MTRIYIKTWEEVKCDSNTVPDFYNESVLSHKYHYGSYSKYSQGRHGGEYLDAEIYGDGQAKANDLWFPKWAYEIPGQYNNSTSGFSMLGSFKNDYEAFQAWQNSIERRKAEAYDRVRVSFRKAFPKEYRNRDEESSENS